MEPAKPSEEVEFPEKSPAPAQVAEDAPDPDEGDLDDLDGRDLISISSSTNIES